MPKQTYEVIIDATAIRSLRVRASSARQALEIAVERAGTTSGPWTICYPGEADGHFSVYTAADSTWMGPGASDHFKDEPEEEDDDD